MSLISWPLQVFSLPLQSQSSLKVFTTLVIFLSLFPTYSSTLCSLTSAHLTLLMLSGQGQQVLFWFLLWLYWPSPSCGNVTFHRPLWHNIHRCSSLSLVTPLQLLCYCADFRIQCSILGGLLFSFSTASLNDLIPLMASVILSFQQISKSVLVPLFSLMLPIFFIQFST